MQPKGVAERLRSAIARHSRQKRGLRWRVEMHQLQNCAATLEAILVNQRHYCASRKLGCREMATRGSFGGEAKSIEQLD